MMCVPAAVDASFYAAREGRVGALENEIEYRVASNADETFEAISEATSGWTSQKSQPYRGSPGAAILWIRFELPAVQAARRVMLTAPVWDYTEFFIVRDGKLADRQKAGMLTPWEDRKTRVTMTPPFSGGFVEVDLLPGTRTTVLARLETSSQFMRVEKLIVSLWESEAVRDGERRDRMGQGIFLGIMLFLIVYNLGLYFVIREPSYLYYVIMEVGFTTAWATLFGINYEFLWPQHPGWDFYCIWMSTAVGGVGLIQFLRHYLTGARYFPRTDTFLRGYAALTLLLIPLVLLPVDIESLLALLVYSSPLGVAVVLFVMVLALRVRHPLAPNLFLAMLCFGAGIFAYAVASVVGVGRAAGAVAHSGQIGSVLAGVILSLGLGYRLQNTRAELAGRQLEEERLRSAHEREKRELIEEQNRTLEAKVVERTAELVASQRQSDVLLANILPGAIIDELREKGETEPRRHEEASILFTDFSGFTQAVATIPAKRLVQELNEIFRAFDDIVANQGLEKIKTIGDAYMAAGGLPVSAEDHAVRCVGAALQLVRFIEERNVHAAMKWGLRVGVHSGAVVAGVVGKNKYAYDVWGDTVNIASRLESAGEVNRVNISAYTYELVRDRFECEYRGKIAAKGKGEIDMYFVLREREPASAQA